MEPQWEFCKLDKNTLTFIRNDRPYKDMSVKEYILAQGGPEKRSYSGAEAIQYLEKDGWKIAGVGLFGCIRFKRIISQPEPAV